VLGAFRSARQTTRRRLTALDLPHRDRACLRILLRAKVATTQHLTELVYHRRQTTQLRLMRLWQAGFIERAVLPPLTRGGAPLVFRLSRRGRARLGYSPLRRSEAGMQLRHDLHVLDVICALARPDARAPGTSPLDAWCTPAMSARFIDGVIPDALVALQLDACSAVLALEVDEGTEHAPVIRAKLARYAEALEERDGWHLLSSSGSRSEDSGFATSRAAPVASPACETERG
jgi:predicted transcriptional regulator